MPKKTALSVPFNVMLSNAERQVLNDLADKHNCSSGFIVRRAITCLAAHESGRPHCANGQPCMVPQMHINMQGGKL